MLLLAAIAGLIGLLAGFSQGSYVEVGVVAVFVALMAGLGFGLLVPAVGGGALLQGLGAAGLALVASFAPGAAMIALDRARRRRR